MMADSAEKIVDFASGNQDMLSAPLDFEVVHHYPDVYFKIDTTAIITAHPGTVQFLAAFALSVSPPNYRMDRLTDGRYAVY